jgi:hypothetical protein
MTMKPIPSVRRGLRRHPGSFNKFDHYRASLTAQRGQATRDAASLKSAWAGFLATVGVLAVALLAATAPRRASTDLKLSDSDEREIERRLLFGYDEKFR